ncbi:MAG: hypothetical protein A2269_09125 [Lentisphaerae bacterium RIFOXYA12_FULL_60_10]|nr:MAG: hypothetical protein A2269_09125 [Lentisphaerae bacterium RIFOXYA12_FULL_60_10]
MSVTTPPGGVPSAMRRHGMGRDTAWNLVGMLLPMVVALFTIPVMIHRMGTARFGVLTLVWMLVGYFSIFDMGLGRALTRLMADRISRERLDEIPGLFWTAIAMMGLLGLTGAGIVLAISGPLALRWLNIADSFRQEALLAFRVVAFGLPVVVMTTGLTGTLEACRRFRLVNLLRMPAGAFTFLGPVLVLPFTTNLTVVVAVLIAGRVAECLGYLGGCFAALPLLRRNIRWEPREVLPLFSFGGWMTVSNLAVPLMQHVDRFIIGMVRSVEAVTFFATPAEIVVRLLIFTRARIAVLFPEFVAGHARGDAGLSGLFARGMKHLLLAVFPIMLGVVVLTPVGLRLWLGPEFEAGSSFVMVTLTIGVMITSMSMVPWFLIQAVGRPDLSARVHLAQLPVYILFTWHLCGRWGIAGSAVAWAVRAAVDWLWMLGLSRRFVDRQAVSWSGSVLPVALATAVMLAAAWPEGLVYRILAGGLGCAVFYIVAWFVVLTAAERVELAQQARAWYDVVRRKVGIHG